LGGNVGSESGVNFFDPNGLKRSKILALKIKAIVSDHHLIIMKIIGGKNLKEK